MYQVRANSIILEIPEATTPVLNSLVLDLADPSTRGITSSNTFKVQLSQVNIEALKFPLPINSTSVSYTRLFPSEILLGKNIVSKGSIRIKNVNIDKNEMSLQFQDESRDFYDNLNRQASDIDFADFDLVFNQTTFDTILNVTTNQIWAYKDLQCAINGTSSNLDIIFKRPCYSFRELLRKFIISVGFTVDFDSIEPNITEIDKLLISSHHDKFFVSDFRQQYENVTLDSITLPIDTNDFTAITTTFISNELANSTYPFSLNLKGKIVANEFSQIKLFVTKSGEDDIEELINISPGDTFINFTSSIFPEGSSVVISSIGRVVFENAYLYLILNEKDIADIEDSWNVASNSILNGYRFLGAQNLPDITQLDLFRLFWSLYFIKIDIDIFKKDIRFRLFGQESELSAIDITSKLNGDGTISPMKLFARQNTFGYSNDADTFQEKASFIFRTDNNIDISTKDYIRLPFAASANKVYGSKNVSRVEVYNKASTFEESESRSELSFRLLLEDGSSAVFKNLDWGFLFNKYYSPLFSRLAGKRLSVEMFMVYEEFKKITDKGFVFIRNKGLFFVENIQAYRQGEPVKISLLFLK